MDARGNVKFLILPTAFSTTTNLETALQRAERACASSAQGGVGPKTPSPVLFIFSLKNFKPHRGIRLNMSHFAAYYQEEEIVITEKAPLFVLAVRKQFL